MRIVCLHSSNPFICQMLQTACAASNELTECEVQRHCVTGQSSLDAWRMAQQPGDVAVFVLDASFESATLRAAARRAGGIHWYFDYFVRPDLRYEQLRAIGEVGAGISSNSMNLEVAASSYAFFATERGAIAAATELHLDATRVGVLSPPVALSSAEIAAARPQGATLRIAVCGRAAIEYRLLPLLRALSRLTVPAELWWMCEDDEIEQVAQYTRDFPNCTCYTVSGRSPSVWTRVLARSDIAYHANQSGYEELFPYVLQSLASGTSVIVSRYASGRDMPDSVLWKIRGGEHEQVDLQDAILAAASGNFAARDKCARALDFVGDIHDPAHIVQQLCAGIKRFPSVGLAHSLERC